MSFFAQSGTESVEAALKLARYRHGARALHRISRRLSRPHHGLAGLHLEQVHPAEGILPDHAGRHARAVSEQLSAAVRRRRPGAGGAALHRGGACSSTTCRPARWRRCWSSRSRARAAISCRRTVFSRACAQLCDRHGILLIFDEVQSGIGRTGKMFAAQHWGVEPDIMTLAKGLGSGLPIGMVVAKRSIMQKWTRGAHGNTFGGNPAVLRGGARDPRSGRARILCERRQGRRLFHEASCARSPTSIRSIGEVRGKGLMIGMELVTRSGEQGAGEEALRRVDHARLSQRPDPAVLRAEHGALHAAAHDPRSGRRRGGRIAR